MHSRFSACLKGLVCAAAFAVVPLDAAAADLDPRTASAYDRYLEAAAQAFAKQTSTDAFLIGGARQTLDRLRQGEILLEPGGGDGIISVPDGLIHHWRATAFVADTTLEQVLRLVRDYVKYPSIYDWVIAADLVAAEGDHSRAFFRARRRAGAVTGVFDVWMVTDYRRVRPGRATSIAAADCVREVKHAGERGEHRLEAGTGSGYLWRADAMSKYLERDGGVYIELDTVGLSRGFPPLLSWIIEPIARRIGRSSATDSLRRLRDALTAPRLDAVASSPVVSARSWCGR
jgi:hypothetical protein